MFHRRETYIVLLVFVLITKLLDGLYQGERWLHQVLIHKDSPREEFMLVISALMKYLHLLNSGWFARLSAAYTSCEIKFRGERFNLKQTPTGLLFSSAHWVSTYLVARFYIHVSVFARLFQSYDRWTDFCFFQHALRMMYKCPWLPLFKSRFEKIASRWMESEWE